MRKPRDQHSVPPRGARAFDPNAPYGISIDNYGEAIADLSLRFRFSNTSKNVALVMLGKLRLPSTGTKASP
jgi:hypothetical protein